MKSKIKLVRERIPSTKEILDEAIKNLLDEYGASELSELVRTADASEIAIQIEKKADTIYRSSERHALKGYLMDKGLSEKDAIKVVDVMIVERDLTTVISNIRRSRAGYTSEAILLRILRALDIPCESGKRGIWAYRPDVVVPSNDVLQKSPQKAAAIAVKRTLRERWASDIDVFKFPHGKFVLLTPDPDFKESKAKDMTAREMKDVYIPDELYESSQFVESYPQFKKLSQLPSELRKILER